MTLFVMSAYVAFNGFPGQDVESPIGNLVLQEQPAPVNVPAQAAQVQVQGATRTPGTGHHGRIAAKRAVGPSATTGPVVKRRLPAATPGSQAPGSATQTAAPATGSAGGQSLPATPQVPTDVLPQLPKVSLPALQAPSQSSLPVDANGVSNAVSGLLGG
jgi:hypothetical protein